LNWGYSHTYKIIDRGFIEMVGPFGLSKLVLNNSKILSKLQTGSFYDYAFWMFGGLMFMSLGFECYLFCNILFDSSLIFLFFVVFLFFVNNKNNF
jgi:NADH-ubiquinone oxidoreductase chain 5